MFDTIRRLVTRQTDEEEMGTEVSIAELDNDVDSGVKPEPMDGKDGWIEPDGAVC